MKILFIGLGSIGRKHISIVQKAYQSVEIYAFRSKKHKKNNVSGIKEISEEQVNFYSFHAIFITNPSFLHSYWIKKLATKNTPIFVEKPLCINRNQYNDLLSLDMDSKKIYVGLNVRFHPVIIFAKKFIEENKEKINEVNIYCGSNLIKWRPMDDYSKSYSAHEKLGGGIHFDSIHELDYMIYIFGQPKNINKYLRKVSNLNLNSIDSAIMIAEYEDFNANITLNYFRNDTKRTFEVVTEKSSYLFDIQNSQVMNLTSGKIISKFSKNSMDISYQNQIYYFFDQISNRKYFGTSFSESLEVINNIL